MSWRGGLELETGVAVKRKSTGLAPTAAEVSWITKQNYDGHVQVTQEMFLMRRTLICMLRSVSLLRRSDSGIDLLRGDQYILVTWYTGVLFN